MQKFANLPICSQTLGKPRRLGGVEWTAAAAAAAAAAAEMGAGTTGAETGAGTGTLAGGTELRKEKNLELVSHEACRVDVERVDLGEAFRNSDALQ